MIRINTSGACLCGGKWVTREDGEKTPSASAPKTMAHAILARHSRSKTDSKYEIVFDGIMAHDITYVSIVQTARAGGMTRFPVPVAMTNCHNSLCAVGGTINADDHRFGLSAARKYGGDFVPANMAVIHQYAREMMAGCGKMIIGSDSHTRYGAIGCMGVGEGGGELVKQLLGHTWDVERPEVAAVWLTGGPRPGVGPHDVALALIRAVYADGVVKNRVMEFMGPGVAGLSMDWRIGIDVMTTETTCLSSIWMTDDKVREYLAAHGREEEYRQLVPEDGAWYDKVIEIDLSQIEPMIALPFHPGNAWPISYFHAHAAELLESVEDRAVQLLGEKHAGAVDLRGKLRNGRLRTDQGVVAGCCGGTYENLCAMAALLKNRSVGAQGFNLSVYPSSQPVLQALLKAGAIEDLTAAGATLHTAFCGPCFGAGDVPGQNCFSIRHVTRNFANREGSKPPEGQISYVALMDARSIAATARNNGLLTAADEDTGAPKTYVFQPGLYERCVYHGQGRPEPAAPLVVGPNIADWPEMPAMPEDLLLGVAAALRDPVTTTDDFIASGEPSAFRSNPGRMAEYTLQRKDPGYVSRAKAWRTLEAARRQAARDKASWPSEVAAVFAQADPDAACFASTGLGSLIFALCPGDGSAREQAASCQKVLGAWANIAGAYATKRYRSNLINWGIVPFVLEDAENADIRQGDLVLIPGIRALLQSGGDSLDAARLRDGQKSPLKLLLPGMSPDERRILLAGSLINSYRQSG